MADNKTIGELDVETTAALTDQLVLWISGLTKRMTLANLKTVLDVNTASRGALATKAANETGANYSAGVMVPWTAEEYDTDDIHDNSSNNTRLTVPSGVTKVRLSYSLVLSSHTSGKFARALVAKNGSATHIPGGAPQSVELTASAPWISGTTAVLEVADGNYFECYLLVETDTSIGVDKDGSFFAMEIIE